MFSIFRSGGKVRENGLGRIEVLTVMDNIVVMTITECTAYLPRNLSGSVFPEAFVADDVVEHLAAVDALENYVIMVRVNDHFAHAADVGMVEED